MLEKLMHEKPLLLIVISNIISIAVAISISLFLYKNFFSTTEKDSLINVTSNYEEEIGSNDAPAKIFAEISGAVNNPGVYELPPYARVVDLLSQANGLGDNADISWFSKNINLSKKIADSEKIYIPFIWDTIKVTTDVGKLVLQDITLANTASESDTHTSSATTTANSTNAGSSTPDDYDKININNASMSDLDALSGVGPAYAQKIIDNRPYKDFEELTTKSTVPSSVLEKNKNLISF